ncbi:MAG: hypothetical protein ACOX2S_05330 [bacterium]
MELTPILALTIVLVVFAIGDVVAIKTKAIVSMMFASSVMLLLSFWAGMPKDLLPQSQLMGIGTVLIGLLITHMGTLMKLRDLLQQWKTVLVAGRCCGRYWYLYSTGRQPDFRPGDGCRRRSPYRWRCRGRSDYV